MVRSIIETERLWLHPVEPSEAGALHALWTLPEVRRYLWDDQVIPPEQTEAILHQSRELFATQRFGLWAAREKDAPELAGFGGFWYFRDPPELELLLGLHPARWRRGLATEAGRALIRYGFETLGLTEIRGSADAANAESVRLMQRLGMQFDRRAVVGGLDTVFFQITRGAWDSSPTGNRIAPAPA